MRHRIAPCNRYVLGGIRLLAVLLLAALFLAMGCWIGGKFTSVSNKVPAWEEALLMDEEELLDIIRDVPLSILRDKWGKPIADMDYEFEKYHEIVWKDADTLDHITLYLDKETKAILSVSVIYVFEAYPVYSVSENLWGTVTPCPGEDELDYGNLIRINFRGRPAVYQSLDPDLPVRIYYKGKPHRDENGGLPYIDSVVDINYFDDILEPLEEYE